MNRIVTFLARLGFWPYILLFTTAAVVISELLIVLQSRWLTGEYFDRTHLAIGFVTSAVDAFVILLLSAFLIRHLTRTQRELEQTQEQLRLTNARLSDAQETAHLGFWEFDLEKEQLFWNDHVYRIFGLDPREFVPSFEGFIAHVYPDDRDALAREYSNSIAERRPYRITHRIIRGDGTIRYVEEHCRHTYDTDGKPVKSIGAVYDVTDRISDQTKLQRLFDLQTNIVIQTDGKQLKKANRSFLEFLGYPSLEAFLEHYRCICDLFVPHEKFFHLERVPEGKNWIEALELLPKDARIVSLIDATLQPHAFSVAINHFEDDDYIVSFSDISATILRQFSLENRLRHDHLTGAHSREFVEENIHHFIERAEKHYRRLGVIIFDVDRFKSVNDTYGHHVGDEVLITLVAAIKRHIRRDDILVRWGGEEFLLFCETQSLGSLEQMAEHVRERVEQHPFETVGQITCSFGIALHDVSGSIYQTIKQADGALYKAKETGRNRVCVAEA